MQELGLAASDILPSPASFPTTTTAANTTATSETGGQNSTATDTTTTPDATTADTVPATTSDGTTSAPTTPVAGEPDPDGTTTAPGAPASAEVTTGAVSSRDSDGEGSLGLGPILGIAAAGMLALLALLVGLFLLGKRRGRKDSRSSKMHAPQDVNVVRICWCWCCTVMCMRFFSSLCSAFHMHSVTLTCYTSGQADCRHPGTVTVFDLHPVIGTLRSSIYSLPRRMLIDRTLACCPRAGTVP